MSLKTHLDVLQDSASQFSTRAAFKLPVQSPGSHEVQEWSSVAYAQFQSDVERYAKYWGRTLASDGLPRRSVVGLWYDFSTYTCVKSPDVGIVGYLGSHISMSYTYMASHEQVIFHNSSPSVYRIQTSSMSSSTKEAHRASFTTLPSATSSRTVL